MSSAQKKRQLPVPTARGGPKPAVAAPPPRTESNVSTRLPRPRAPVKAPSTRIGQLTLPLPKIDDTKRTAAKHSVIPGPANGARKVPSPAARPSVLPARASSTESKPASAAPNVKPSRALPAAETKAPLKSSIVPTESTSSAPSTVGMPAPVRTIRTLTKLPERKSSLAVRFDSTPNSAAARADPSRSDKPSVQQTSLEVTATVTTASPGKFQATVENTPQRITAEIEPQPRPRRSSSVFSTDLAVTLPGLALTPPVMGLIRSQTKQSNNISTDSSSSSFKKMLAKRFRKAGILKSQTWGGIDRSTISGPILNGHLELQRSSTQPYESIEANGEEPIHVTSARDPSIVSFVTMPLSALPRTSTSLTDDFVPPQKLKPSGTWDSVKSLTSKQLVQPSKLFGSHAAKPKKKADASTQSLQGERRNSGDTYWRRDSYISAPILPQVPMTNASERSLLPPPRPPRPESLFPIFPDQSASVYALVPQPRCDASVPVREESLSPVARSSASDEQARIERHRRRAYYTLEGITRKGLVVEASTSLPTDLDEFGPQLAPLPSPSLDPASTITGRHGRPLRRMTEREMLELVQREKTTRPDSPTLPDDQRSSLSIEDVDPETPREFDHMSEQLFSEASGMIVSKQKDTPAWWEIGEIRESPQCVVEDSDLVTEQSPLRTRSHKAQVLNASSRPKRLDSAGQESQAATAYTVAPTARSDTVARAHKHQKSGRAPHEVQSKLEGDQSRADSTSRSTQTADIEPAPSPNTSSEFHISSSDSSLSGPGANALGRYGKPTRKLNPDEAAHAVKSITSAMLSQCSLGLSEQQKQQMKPEPLRPSLPTPPLVAATPVQTTQRRRPPPPPPPHPPRAHHSRAQRPSPPPPPRTPPIPHRSSKRPPLTSTRTPTALSALPSQDTTGDNNTTITIPITTHRRNLSTISEEVRSMLSTSLPGSHAGSPQPQHANVSSTSDTTDMPGPFTPARQQSRFSHTTSTTTTSSSSSSSSSASTASNCPDRENWWSDDESPSKPGVGKAGSSKDTTPEKLTDTFPATVDTVDGTAENQVAGAGEAQAADEISDSERVEREILGYYMDKRVRLEARAKRTQSQTQLHAGSTETAIGVGEVGDVQDAGPIKHVNEGSSMKPKIKATETAHERLRREVQRKKRVDAEEKRLREVKEEEERKVTEEREMREREERERRERVKWVMGRLRGESVGSVGAWV